MRAGRYGVTATATDHTGGYTGDVAVADGTTTTTTVKLEGEYTVVRGTIVDDATGAAIARAHVVASRISNFSGDLFAVDAPAGKFEVRLPRAQYYLTIGAAGHADDHRLVRGDGTAAITVRLGHAWPAGPAPKTVIAWLRAHAVPLTSVEPGSGFDDLRPLVDVVGDARIVGLGEATHNTREFFQLKHRLFEWLVAERGFTVFAIEATMPEAFELNDYLLNGHGDARRLLAGLHFWIWDTEEVLHLIRWMRAWNLDPTHRPVKFYGFDMQYAPRAIEVAKRYVARVAPAEVKRMFEPLGILSNELDRNAVWLLDGSARKALEASAQAIVDRFDHARQEWTAHSSADEWTVARQHARIVVQNIENSAPDAYAAGLRDGFMAENIAWIAEHEPAKIFLWAHNVHIAHANDSYATMGQHLHDVFGESYVAVGLRFDHGSFGARDYENDDRLRSFPVEPMPPGSLDGTLAATGLPRFVVDLRAAPAGVVRDWLRSEHGSRDVGAAFSPAWSVAKVGGPLPAARRFDVLGFVAETTAARPLPTGRTWSHSARPALGNGDFETGDVPDTLDWRFESPAIDYEFAPSTTRPFAGRRCGSLTRKTPLVHDSSYGVFEQYVDAKPYRGQHLHLHAAVRAETPTGSNARLYLLVEEGFKTVAAETMRSRPITRRGWHDYDIEVPVSQAATGVWVGGALMGAGSACFDEMKLRGETTP